MRHSCEISFINEKHVTKLFYRQGLDVMESYVVVVHKIRTVLSKVGSETITKLSHFVTQSDSLDIVS